MAIQSGENPKFLQERLLTFMNEKQWKAERRQREPMTEAKTPGKKK